MRQKEFRRMSPSPVATDDRATFTVREVTRAPGDFEPGDDYFSTPREPFGARQLRLQIGPLCFVLDGLSDGQEVVLRQRFRPFVDGTDGAPAADLTVRFARAGVDAFLAAPKGEAERYRMGRRKTGSQIAMWSYEFAGSADIASGRADLALVDAGGPAFERGAENFLRVLTALHILGCGGLLVHGAGVVRHGLAHVFFGPSGSGKTTVTHLSPGDTILSDDLTLIVKTEGGYAAAGIPFGMAHHRVPDTNGCFPIAGLHRLVQSRSVRREPLSGAKALAELACCLPFVMQDESSAGAALAIASSIVSSVPIDRLLFRRDPSFWDVAREASGR
jgi:hypothetical protein